MNEQINRIIRHPATIPAAIGVVSFGSGIFAGYHIGWRRGFSNAVYGMEAERLVYESETTITGPPEVVLDVEDLETLRERWAEQTDTPAVETIVSERILTPEEVTKSVEFHELRYRTDGGGMPETGIVGRDVPEPDPEPEYPQFIIDAAAQAGVTPEKMANDLTRLQTAYEKENGEDIQTNVFANSTEGWDYETEVEAREGKSIYIIHRDEYDAQEEGYTQVTLTYFAGDDLMAEGEADDELQLVPNHFRIIGDELRFGHGSNDPNVFYVRNVEGEVEYQVLRVDGHYTVDVMGLEMESERASHRVRRMRDDSTET